MDTRETKEKGDRNGRKKIGSENSVPKTVRKENHLRRNDSKGGSWGPTCRTGITQVFPEGYTSDFGDTVTCRGDYFGVVGGGVLTVRKTEPSAGVGGGTIKGGKG